MINTGKLFVFSGPSGAGKGSVVSKLIENNSDLSLSISCTTRLPRNGEKEGTSYYFISNEKFMKMRESNDFFEWQFVYNNYYGTPKSQVYEKLNNGQDVILEIDIQGALDVKKNYPDAILIFILPPDSATLSLRLKQRSTETAEQLLLRQECMNNEIKLCINYDFIIINESLNNCIKQAEQIICAQNCAVKFNKPLINKILGGKF